MSVSACECMCCVLGIVVCCAVVHTCVVLSLHSFKSV